MNHDTDHRSFRLTPPAHTRGKKVKRRLFWVAIAIATLSAAFACLAALMVVLVPWNDAVSKGGVLALALLAGVLVHLATACAGVRLASLLRLLTPHEASEFHFGLGWGRHWPESWLEET